MRPHYYPYSYSYSYSYAYPVPIPIASAITTAIPISCPHSNFYPFFPGPVTMGPWLEDERPMGAWLEDKELWALARRRAAAHIKAWGPDLWPGPEIEKNKGGDGPGYVIMTIAHAHIP